MFFIITALKTTILVTELRMKRYKIPDVFLVFYRVKYTYYFGGYVPDLNFIRLNYAIFSVYFSY